MNTSLSRKLFVVVGAAAPLNPKLCRKLFDGHPFHFRNVYSNLAHSLTLFSQFASTKLNFSDANITRIFKLYPPLQRLQTLEKVEQFIHLLNSYGCSQVQISSIIRRRPDLIQYNEERILEPKIKLLEDSGFEGQTLTKLLTLNPSFLRCGLENDLLPKMGFLKNVFQSQDVLVKALLKAPLLLSSSMEKTLKPSYAFWEGWGFRGKDFHKFFLTHPLILMRTSVTPAQADLIHKIAVDRDSKTFKYILGRVAVSRMETLEAKIHNLRSWGLSAEETWEVFRASPPLLCYSKETISAKMNFLVNDMELPPNCVVKHPFLLLISLEKVIRPRFLVWQKMKSINDPPLPLFGVLRMREAKFVNKIIKGHPESKTLYTIYESAISNDSIQTKSSAKMLTLD